MKKALVGSISDRNYLSLGTLQLERIVDTVCAHKNSIILPSYIDDQVRRVCTDASVDIYNNIDARSLEKCSPIVKVKTYDCKSIGEIVISGRSTERTRFEFSISFNDYKNDLCIYTPFSVIDLSEKSSADYLKELAILTERIHNIDWKEFIDSYSDKFPDIPDNNESVIYLDNQSTASYVRENLKKLLRESIDRDDVQSDLEKIVAQLESCDFGDTLVTDKENGYIYLILDVVGKGSSFLVKKIDYKYKYMRDSNSDNKRNIAIFENVKESRVRKDLFAKRLYRKGGRLINKIADNGKIEAVLLKNL